MKRIIIPFFYQINQRKYRSMLIFFSSATIVNIGNFLFNLLLGRWLGPSSFSDLSVVITLFLTIMFFAATLQTATAHFTAIYTSRNDLKKIANLRMIMLRWAAGIGIFLMSVFGFGSSVFQEFFGTDSEQIFIIFAFGIPFYMLQGVNRGILQGQTRFRSLSATYQVEMWTRLVTGLAFVILGLGANGAVLGLSLSFVATWLSSQRVRIGMPQIDTLRRIEQKKIFIFSGGITVIYLSQILITSSDILIVKHFFPAEIAGEYAALALIGRVVYFAAWAITIVIFPLVTQRHNSGKSHKHLLKLAIAAVFLISCFTIVLTYLFPETIVSLLFGEAYFRIAPLIWQYSIVAAIFSLASVTISYYLALGNKAGGMITLYSGLAQIAALWIWHNTLEQVIGIQILVMSAYLFTLVISNFQKSKLETSSQSMKSLQNI